MEALRVNLTKKVSIVLNISQPVTAGETKEALDILSNIKVAKLSYAGQVLNSGDIVSGDVDVVVTPKPIREVTEKAKPFSASASALKGARKPDLKKLGTPVTPARSSGMRVERPTNTSPKKETPKIARPTPRKTSGETKVRRSVPSPDDEKSFSRQHSKPTKHRVTPALEEARQRLSKTTPDDIRKITGITQPPPALTLLIENMMLTCGASNKSWEAAMRELGDMRFLNKLCNIEPQFSDRVIRKLENCVYAGEEVMKKVAGVAGVNLLTWLKALTAACKVAPVAEEKPERHATHEESQEEMEKLKQAAAALSEAKNSDFRDFRTYTSTNHTSVPGIALPMAGMQAALGKRDTSMESGLRMTLNPSTLKSLLIDAATDPAKHLTLDRSEFIAFQKIITHMDKNTTPLEKEPAALAAIVQWVKAAYQYSSIKHKSKDEARRQASATPPPPLPSNGNGHQKVETHKDPEPEVAPAVVDETPAPAPAEPEPVPEPEAAPEPEVEQAAENVEPEKEAEPVPAENEQIPQKESEEPAAVDPPAEETPAPEPEPVVAPNADIAPEDIQWPEDHEHDETF
eukprot:TRINITY_DN5792_c0_g1_i1.p1 TRINITY_DN5792_c0_g1~~TRINITY_DN5792_c0_g1_i1.p1  ORF type:complete len:573 (+),score=145.08 TRINITY_DN5792_c0_g1_i1:43-1761(+)